MEKMVWRHESPVCARKGTEADLCLGTSGMRRVVFDPRRVGMLTQHLVTFPALQGLDLKTDVARVNKFVVSGGLPQLDLTSKLHLRSVL